VNFSDFKRISFYSIEVSMYQRFNEDSNELQITGQILSFDRGFWEKDGALAKILFYFTRYKKKYCNSCDTVP
jgi:hypothetical protein